MNLYCFFLFHLPLSFLLLSFEQWKESFVIAFQCRNFSSWNLVTHQVMHLSCHVSSCWISSSMSLQQRVGSKRVCNLPAVVPQSLLQVCSRSASLVLFCNQCALHTDPLSSECTDGSHTVSSRFFMHRTTVCMIFRHCTTLFSTTMYDTVWSSGTRMVVSMLCQKAKAETTGTVALGWAVAPPAVSEVISAMSDHLLWVCRCACVPARLLCCQTTHCMFELLLVHNLQGEDQTACPQPPIFLRI